MWTKTNEAKYEARGWEPALLVFQNESGGLARIVVDDKCLVFVVRQTDGTWKASAWWPWEVHDALVDLREATRSAEAA